MTERVIQREYGQGGFEVPLANGKTRSGDATIKEWKTSMEQYGNKLQIVPVHSYNLDSRAELAHTTTGLKYALRGRAEVIEARVGERLAAFKDPIKSILPVRIVDGHRVIVRTKMVTGGRAIIAPERAPARTVGVQETVHEVELERYGGDLEMNLNLQHEPSLFQEELEMKIQAQQRELERVLIEIGYDELLRGGLRLDMAILRSLAGPGEGLENSIFIKKANEIYSSKCFATMNKTPFPLQSILSAAKHATAYSVGAPGSILILPHGLPELLRYAKPESMVFNVNGLKTTDNKPVTMDLGIGHTDPATNITMLTHIPLPTFEYGSANPRVGMGCLTERVTVIDYCYLKTGMICDATTKGLVPVPADWEGQIVCRKTVLTMSSAILAAPGADTGELLVGMPHTGVSTSQTDETMKMQLRVYLGAVLKRPESAIILPHVVCESLISQEIQKSPEAEFLDEASTLEEFETWANDDQNTRPLVLKRFRVGEEDEEIFDSTELQKEWLGEIPFLKEADFDNNYDFESRDEPELTGDESEKQERVLLAEKLRQAVAVKDYEVAKGKKKEAWKNTLDVSGTIRPPVITIGSRVLYHLSAVNQMDLSQTSFPWTIANRGPLGEMDNVLAPHMASLMHGDMSSMMKQAVPGYEVPGDPIQLIGGAIHDFVKNSPGAARAGGGGLAA